MITTLTLTLFYSFSSVPTYERASLPVFLLRRCRLKSQLTPHADESVRLLAVQSVCKADETARGALEAAGTHRQHGGEAVLTHRPPQRD